MSPSTHKETRILLAGGGTGGHIYPGVALAQEFLARGSFDCLMVVTSKDMDRHIMESERMPYAALPVKGLRQGITPGRIADVYHLALSFVRTWRIIASYRPDAVIGLGAYVSLPAISIGKLKGITTFIHEQNLVPGKVNLLLGRWTDGIFTSFPQTDRYFPAHKVRMLGNPLRSIPSNIDRTQGRLTLGLKPDLITLLVTGGSRGAHAINLNAMDAFAQLKSEGIPFQVIHQTGDEDYDRVLGWYAGEGIRAKTGAFFDNMMEMYLLSDLVICRAGAGTLAELTATGTPALLIPYPYAKADHQTTNAMAMVNAGAARMIRQCDLSGKVLAKEIGQLLNAPEILGGMARASRVLGRPHAAREICDQAIAWLAESQGRTQCTLN